MEWKEIQMVVVECRCWLSIILATHAVVSFLPRQ